VDARRALPLDVPGGGRRDHHLLLHGGAVSPAGIPGNAGFALDNGVVNYAPVLVGTIILFAGVWWVVSAKNWFTGPEIPSAAEVEAELAAD